MTESQFQARLSRLDTREAKLPKWAQDLLFMLRDDLHVANEALTKLDTVATAASRIVVNPYGSKPVALKANDRIELRLPGLPEKAWFKPAVQVRFSNDGKSVEVSSPANFIAVRPQVANVIVVDVLP